MVNGSPTASSPEWNGTRQCPFCQYELDNGGEAFIRHVDTNEECYEGFERWRDNVAGDMQGEWSG
jgi:sarcosine oxidase delta subunit